jgi:4-diphosphocytidyl-2-C-methyl-D-erythritol kinase
VTTLHARAPGKVNLCLYLGERRPDGLHDLVSLLQAVSLADELTLEAAPGAESDEVVCPGVEGENLAARALAVYRESRAWAGPPVRLTIDKRVPVAAGMGGGSSDAAAALRMINAVAAREENLMLMSLAFRLGADVPALLEPGLMLVAGAGEKVSGPWPRRPYVFVIVPSREQLSTAEVYAEADRQGLARSPDELAERHSELERAVQENYELPHKLFVNDLEPAARALCPAVDEALEATRAVGAQLARVSGSGPTVFGLFPNAEAADEAAQQLADRFPGARAAVAVATAAGAVEER